ncbi:MAG: UDP-glucose 4-epimerase GalE [Candidatus Aureabacteria bacterium]|nr:UDP-glucose 4-epimerase GalE [Candidatus Auribacterota bacterium]NLW95125.1 UDP-glucose 4-epimerase GalE [Chlamydiota bacterium]HOE27538.1 UDP-glucose 4-epimerase GalE [bacterium]HQM52438.1 UDP-glucose 4-epimerase GalE [bacterium]
MRVLVTGGAGYIGSVTVAALLEGGHEVLVFDSLEHGHRGAVAPGARLVVGDLADGGAIEKALRTHRAEAVVHFAAYSLVGESVAQPARYFLNNVSNGLVLLEAMRRTGVGRIVFSSSAAVYGSPRRIPIAEDDPAEPINPYGESKLFLERVLGRYHRAYGLECVSLRYFNAAGATPACGEDHDPETHLIPSVLRAALGKAPAVKLFGTDYETPDGTCVRDYVDVGDLADAHVLALNCRGERTYNLGDGRGFSVREVLDAARRVTGLPIPEEAAPRRPGDPAVLIAGAERIRRELGWTPRRTGLDEIIGGAWEWMRRNPEGYRD